MEADKVESHDAVAGQVERGVRPLAGHLRVMARYLQHAQDRLRVQAAADELERLEAALATESSRKCASEHDCVWQPHCAHAGKCMRPERPAVA